MLEPNIYIMPDIVSFSIMPLAKFVVIPVVTIALGSLIRYLCDRGKSQLPVWEYFYWGPNLITSALLIAFVDFCNNIVSIEEITKDIVLSSVNSGLWIIIQFVIAATCIIGIVHKWGWKSYRGRNPSHSLWLGIIIPDIIGFIFLFLILNNSSL